MIRSYFSVGGENLTILICLNGFKVALHVEYALEYHNTIKRKFAMIFEGGDVDINF